MITLYYVIKNFDNYFLTTLCNTKTLILLCDVHVFKCINMKLIAGFEHSVVMCIMILGR